jgi:uncharacterized protein YecT (DUF1311 family)
MRMLVASLLGVTSFTLLAADIESTSHAIRKKAPKGISESFYSCLDRASGSAIDEASCVANEKSYQNDRLNRNYNKLLNVLKGNMKNDLIVSEKAWLNARDKDGALESLLYGDDSQIGNLQQEQNDVFRLCERANVLENYFDIANLAL